MEVFAVTERLVSLSRGFAPPPDSYSSFEQPDFLLVALGTVAYDSATSI
jgi:hypothetical protein